MVDQMRADAVDHFKGDWSAGLKRLVTKGAWFRRAAYPYLTTVTCAGHATVSSGAFPNTHGVFENAWWDREAHRVMTCTEDPNAKDIGYDTSVRGGDSGYRLLIPSFADEMRSQRSAHVVSLSLKDRSAIMLAGHGADAAAWFANTLDGWVTTSALTNQPVAAIKSFSEANPMAADYGKTWSRLLPDSQYQGPDDGVAEAPPSGWTRTFPHVLRSGSGKPDLEFRRQWETSPYADAYLGRFAAALIESLQLGKHDGIDVLGVSFSSPDLVGHAFGPRSQEVQDMYAHLDRTIGTLLDRLDVLVGRDEYVVGLTADHGVTPIPEQLLEAGENAGRLNVAGMIEAVEERVRAALGPGKYVPAMSGNDLYFEPGVYAALRAKPGALDAVVAALASRPGVARVFRGEQLRDAAHAADPLLRAAALSYFPGRSGDLIVALKPGWMSSGSGTTHHSATPDDQRVPILFMGRGIKPGVYSQAATPADVAPTLAAICGITMRQAEGHALREALTFAPGPGSAASSSR
jgi:predicted AlkP superfamily pyrophosphatase or phosphodiesterase